MDIHKNISTLRESPWASMHISCPMNILWLGRWLGLLPDGCLAGCSAGWLLAAGWLAGEPAAAGHLVGWLAAGLPGWLLAHWLASCKMAGRLAAGRLAGWLAQKNGPLSEN